MTNYPHKPVKNERLEVSLHVVIICLSRNICTSCILKAECACSCCPWDWRVDEPRTGLDDVEKRKLFPLPGLELRPLGHLARSQLLYWFPNNRLNTTCPSCCTYLGLYLLLTSRIEMTTLISVHAPGCVKPRSQLTAVSYSHLLEPLFPVSLNLTSSLSFMLVISDQYKWTRTTHMRPSNSERTDRF
jgi:hypothetical protein